MCRAAQAGLASTTALVYRGGGVCSAIGDIIGESAANLSFRKAGNGQS